MATRALLRSSTRLPRTGPTASISSWARRPRSFVVCPDRFATTARRHFQLPTALLPPVMFVGLFCALWTWKCLMMVVFQNKIIYMPGMPPNARWEKISDYASQCGGVQWREERIRAADGTDLALCIASVASSVERGTKAEVGVCVEVPIYILYFQGNASSIPPRLPDLSWVLRALSDRRAPTGYRYKYTMACLSYRGYWTSRGRATEKGINKDTEAAARWVAEKVGEARKGTASTDPVLILWGQSIGSGFATNLAVSPSFPRALKLNALLLETPFLSVRTMLETLYPQKWLPYRYLWPFLRNHLHTWENLGLLPQRANAVGVPTVTIIEAGRDELVPAEHAAKIEQRCKRVGIPVHRRTVAGAYHNEASFRAEGKKAILAAIEAEAAKAVGRT